MKERDKRGEEKGGKEKNERQRGRRREGEGTHTFIYTQFKSQRASPTSVKEYCLLPERCARRHRSSFLPRQVRHLSYIHEHASFLVDKKYYLDQVIFSIIFILLSLTL